MNESDALLLDAIVAAEERGAEFSGLHFSQGEQRAMLMDEILKSDWLARQQTEPTPRRRAEIMATGLRELRQALLEDGYRSSTDPTVQALTVQIERLEAEVQRS